MKVPVNPQNITLKECEEMSCAATSFFKQNLVQFKANKLRMDSSPEENSACEQKIEIQNSHNEKLVGLLHETGSREVVVL